MRFCNDFDDVVVVVVVYDVAIAIAMAMMLVGSSAVAEQYYEMKMNDIWLEYNAKLLQILQLLLLVATLMIWHHQPQKQQLLVVVAAIQIYKILHWHPIIIGQGV